MAASEERQRPSSLYMDLKELRVRFCEVDVEDKGYIDYSGLQVMISTMEGFDSSASKELMVALDRDGDGKVRAVIYNILYAFTYSLQSTWITEWVNAVTNLSLLVYFIIVNTYSIILIK